ncbi:hypothetical protein Amet_3741 [Alkaliphilus metalliredigens QYMF]|uniref:Uncharacterized protein n=1 Tax=Alkaliphilus metalliredigens (strain QYMF) TaxID=293826 RepID=A6TUJ2_ALKMQ|nr:DUF2007 domain-containing protein [Alkaliphilus metalliredigens]ABR49860.1 hypothetical protein Amet_3741 [Alkaliphilus metalliredigens QYMF]
MPWCPECGSEYRDGFKKCNDCDIDLIEELEKSEDEPMEFDSEVFLTSASDDMNTRMIEAKLNDSGIPVLKKHRGAGGYLSIYMGMSTLGVDLYVPSRLFEQAKEILLSEGVLEDIDAAIDNEEDYEDETLIEEESKHQEKKKNRGRILFLLMFPGFIWLAYILMKILIEKLF